MITPQISFPRVIEIEPTEHCNLRCRMCHVSYMPAEKRKLFDLSLLENLKELRDCYVIVGSSYEPTIHPSFDKVLDFVEQGNHRLELVTNGTKVTQTFAERLATLRTEIVTVSFDGIKKETYEYIRRGARYEQVVEGVRLLRQALDRKGALLAINFTVMRSYMSEMLEAVRFWNEVGVDQIRLISSVLRDDDAALLGESLWPVRQDYFALLDEVARVVTTEKLRISVRSPYYYSEAFKRKTICEPQGDCVLSDHAVAVVIPMNRQTLQLEAGKGFGQDGDCVSPFEFARIASNGDVLMCNTVPVGNLATASIADIWNGDLAREVRKEIATSGSLCAKCDYYKFCLKSNKIDLENFSSSRSEKLSRKYTDDNVLRIVIDSAKDS